MLSVALCLEIVKIALSSNLFKIVDKLEPLGLEFFWQLVLECQDEYLAEDAMKLLLDMSYMSLSMRLKRDPAQLHARFVTECYRKLEVSVAFTAVLDYQVHTLNELNFEVAI